MNVYVFCIFISTSCFDFALFCCCLGSVIPSLGLLGIAWLGCDRVSILVLLAVSGAFQGAIYAGNQMNHIALSPKYAGTMYGITNAAANVCGFLAPYVIGLIIEGRVSYAIYVIERFKK